MFPQLQALGGSKTALFYGFGSPEEAQVYVSDAEVGPKLTELCENLRGERRTKRASLVWLARRPQTALLRDAIWSALSASPNFQAALKRYYDSAPDHVTLTLLAKANC